MFIFVQPMFSKQEVNGDSNYVIFTALIRAMRKHRPDWVWVMPFPDANSGFKYDNDGFFESPNVVRVPQRISPRKHANALSYDGTWYDKVFRAFGFQIVWCNLVEAANALSGAGTACYGKDTRPVTIAAHHYVIHESLPYGVETSSMYPTMLAQMTGALGADCNVFNSDYCQAMFRDNMKKWLSQYAADRIEANSVRIDHGTLEDIWPATKRGTCDVPLIAYNHRLQAYKRFRETFELLNELWKKGLRFRLRYMNNTTENVAHISHYPWVEVKLCATRDDYLKALSECDINVLNSQYETFCVSAIESMRFGQPLIAPNGMTFPTITGAPINKYPYLFDTPAEQAAMITTLVTNSAERLKWGDILGTHVAANYGQSLWAERYAALFERLEAERILNTRQEIIDACAGIIKAPTPITELFNKLNAISFNGVTSVSSQSFPLAKIARLVELAGGKSFYRDGKQYCVTK